MSLIQPALSFLQTKTAAFGDVLATLVFALRKEIVAAAQRRRDRAALNSLDDYLLKDMGISRCDIDRLVDRIGSHRRL